jgi:hypothetical protein
MDSKVLETVIEGSSSLGYFKVAQQWFHVLKSCGLPVTRSTWSALATGYLKARNLGQYRRLVMQVYPQEGIRPTKQELWDLFVLEAEKGAYGKMHYDMRQARTDKVSFVGWSFLFRKGVSVAVVMSPF